MAPDDALCRYGGEELVVFFPQKNIRDVEPIIEKVCPAKPPIRTPGRGKSEGQRPKDRSPTAPVAIRSFQFEIFALESFDTPQRRILGDIFLGGGTGDI